MVDCLTFTLLLKVLTTEEESVLCLLKLARTEKAAPSITSVLGLMLGSPILFIIGYDAGTVYGGNKKKKKTMSVGEQPYILCYHPKRKQT